MRLVVRDVGFESNKAPFMVIDVRTKVAKFAVECIDLGKEAFFHFRHRSNVVVFQRGHRSGMAFHYLTESFVQLVKQRIKNRVQFLIKRIQFVIKRSNCRVQFLIMSMKDLPTSGEDAITAL